MHFHQITDPRLAQNAYLIGCEQTRQALLIDPQRDIDRYAALADAHGLTIAAAADTHIHADYLSGLRQCAHDWNVEVLVSGEGGEDWQYNWVRESEYRHRLLKDGDTYALGSIEVRVLHTPGHTPEHLTFLIAETSDAGSEPLALITGDFVFVGDVGRPDLLESAAGIQGTMRQSARVLFDSIQRFRKIDPSLRLWPGHGAGSACGKALGCDPSSTVGIELEGNPSLCAATDPDTFVEFILADQPEPPPYFARMKRDNRDGPALLMQRPNPCRLTPIEVKRRLTDPRVAVLDCREWPEYSAGHFPGALYTPLNTSLTTSIGSYVQPHETVVVVCNESDVDEVVAACLNVGVDNVAGWLSPADVSACERAGLPWQTTMALTVADLPVNLSAAGITLLDVRRSAELKETGHIAGAWNIPHTQLLTRHEELPRDRTIHVLCRTGNRSGYAASYLQRLGYNVVYVGGGIVQWLELGRPVLRTDPSTPISVV